jgi:hypothetical protein
MKGAVIPVLLLVLGAADKDSQDHLFFKRLRVTAVDATAARIDVREADVEVSWDKQGTQFLVHRSVPMKDLKPGTTVHVFGKLNSPRQRGSAYQSESIITEATYLGTGDAHEPPLLKPTKDAIRWHTGTLTSVRTPFYLKIAGVDFRLALPADQTVYAVDRIAPQAVVGKTVMVRGEATRSAADKGKRQVTRVQATEVHLLELNPEHKKIFQLHWGEGRKASTGLRGEYFDKANLTELKASRTDATVDFEWGDGAPDPAIDPDSFSVRWTGQLEPPVSETFTFHVLSDDGARLYIDNQLLIDKWVGQTATESTGTLALTAGKKYDLRLEYFDNTRTATVKLMWSSHSVTLQVIPQAHLSPPAGKPAPPAAASKGKEKGKEKDKEKAKA